MFKTKKIQESELYTTSLNLNDKTLQTIYKQIYELENNPDKKSLILKDVL